MATYVNDLRLKEITTGEESGTWGTSTNTNLELIADAFSYATKDCFATDADATETMADGSADEIRSLYLKVTSSATLTATRTLTLAPNTVSKVWIIENATTGSQSISISQGSGANVTIPNGDVKIVYTDGAGATAAVTDAFANLKVTDPAQPNITSVGTLTGLTTTGDINFGDNDKAVFGAGSDLQIYHDGTHSYISDQGTGDLRIIAEDFRVRNAADDETMIQANIDGDVSLWYNNSKKLATTNTGIDVTGTVVADGLTVDDVVSIDTSTGNAFSSTGNLKIDIDSDNSQTDRTFQITSDGNSKVLFQAEEGGDISFYDDTGVSQALFWDASAESLGIGTSSPSNTLHLSSTSPQIRLEDTDATGYSKISGSTGNIYIQADEGNTVGSSKIDFRVDGLQRAVINNNGDISFYEDTGTTAKLFWDASAESLGIGTTSAGDPITPLVINKSDSSAGYIRFTNSDATSGFYIGLTASEDALLNNQEASNMIFHTSNTERMRIDSSGNLLVGKTSSALNTAGFEVASSGRTRLTRDSANVVEVNRTTNDGSLVTFYKDGSTVGSINSISSGGSQIVMANVNTGLCFRDNQAAILPATSTTLRDNAIDLGNSSFRFDDIYATNGTIQTSDRNEKQDIEALTEAETRVAIAAKGLLRKFRWQSAVEEKGDEARIHFGIIAQDLQDAFTAEGLDAGDYAMFISSTWTDDDGVEQTRLGVRYSELLAFIIAGI